ncbi:MAG TPA: mechanosensitive ion channel domain-containing protein [Terriglobales bacterium]|nr:mechanosensitive ion channel domain-containing protein [Terriglobales bacterium]
MSRFLVVLLLVFALDAQTPVPERDPLGRNTPQDSVFHFLETCHARDYSKALRYLDLRKMAPADRAKEGPELAQQLEDLLDDTPFDITMLSRDPEGDQSDGLPAARERLDTFKVDGQTLELQLEHVELNPGFRVWVVSSDSIPLIPKAHQLVTESPFEKKLPQQLVEFEIFDTPVWRWLALIIMAVVLWILAGLVSWVFVRALRQVAHASAFRGPLRIGLTTAGLRAGMELAPLATLPRLYVGRAIGLAFLLAIAWAGAVVIDLISERWRSRLDPRMQAVSYSVLPLGRQVIKLLIFLFAILSVLSVWGYNTSTILAGLGVGGLAVALAAQKTIENLFGGISVIGDRPVLVGDLCRFGDRTGTVMHIGLRSTRIRTPERTIVSIPNSQFSSMALENISGRDKIWFHPMLNLRRDTTSDQLKEVLSSVSEILRSHPKVETGNLPVRFVGVGAYSLDIEVVAYVKTADPDQFLALQQELLLKILQAVEQAGTALAVPLQESFESLKSARA